MAYNNPNHYNMNNQAGPFWDFVRSIATAPDAANPTAPREGVDRAPEGDGNPQAAGSWGPYAEAFAHWGPPPPPGAHHPPPPPHPHHGPHHGPGSWENLWGPPPFPSRGGRHGRHGRHERGGDREGEWEDLHDEDGEGRHRGPPHGRRWGRHGSRSRSRSRSGDEKDAEKDMEKDAEKSGDDSGRGEGRHGAGGRHGRRGRRCGAGPHGPPGHQAHFDFGQHGHRGPHGIHGHHGHRRGGWGGPRGHHGPPPPPFPPGPGAPGAPFDLSQLLGSLAAHPLAQPFLPYFQQAAGASRESTATAAGDNEGDVVTPPVDIFSTPTSYILHVSIPGAKKEDVGVNWDVEKSELNIAGVIYRAGDEEFLRSLTQSERRVGLFERNVTLPLANEKEEIDGDGIAAKLEDGVLIVTVPKVEKEWTEVKKVNVV